VGNREIMDWVENIDILYLSPFFSHIFMVDARSMVAWDL